MKKTVLKILIIVLPLILIASVIVACLVHEHTFVWHYDTSGHLKEMTCGCKYDKDMLPHNDADQDGRCDECDFNLNAIAELSDMFKTAYVNSFEEKFEADFDKIYIRNYYGMIGDAHIVSIYSEYVPYPSGKGYPDNAYIQRLEGMEFRYDSHYVYVIYNEKLYSAKSAYENNIIDFNGLCKVFGLHTSNYKHTFNEKVYNDLKASMKIADPEWADYYSYQRYYGEYNGYHAVSFNFSGGQAAASFEEYYNNLGFTYGYESGRIRLMNKKEMYTLDEAMEKGIIDNDDLFELFNIHTKSQGVNQELTNTLLTPAYELCLKYKEGFREELTFEKFFLEKYYGEFEGCYIFQLSTPCWIKTNLVSVPDEDFDIMQYGFSHFAYVLYQGKLYTIGQALDIGLITSEIYNKVNLKYYSVG